MRCEHPEDARQDRAVQNFDGVGDAYATSVVCMVCGTTLSLGDSNDDGVAVEVEMRAAELAYESDWLAGEIVTHDQRDARDATAWSWSIDRPIAEQAEEIERLLAGTTTQTGATS